MAGVELGTAYLSLIASTGGLAASVRRGIAQTEPVAEKGGKAAGGKFSGAMGKALKAGLAAVGIAGVAAGMAKAFGDGIEREKLGDKTAASLGLNSKQAKVAGKVSGQLYAGAWGGSMEEVNGAVESVMSSINGMTKASPGQLKRVTAAALDIASAFDVDVDQAATNAGILMKNGLAPNAMAAMDLITAGLQKVPKSLRGEVMDATQEYSQFFGSLGYTGKESMALLVSASEDGQYGIDKVGDAIKEFTIRATDGSKSTKDAFSAIGLDAGKMSNKLLAGGDTAKGAFDKIVNGLKNIKDPAKRSQAAIALFGTPLEDLGTKDIPKFLDSLTGTGEGLGKVKGAAKDMGDTLNDNLGTKIEGWKRSAQLFASEGLMAMIDGFETGKSKGAGFFGFLSTVGAKAKEVFGGIKQAVTAFTAAWKYNDGEITSSGINGFMEHLGFIARRTFDWIKDNMWVVKALAIALVGIKASILAYQAAVKVTAAVMKAWVVVTKVWTVVTKVAAVATRILGAAIRFMTGPIGLIITGITLLVGALVWFFTKTKVGKKIIQVVWAGIKAAIKGVADWWTKTAWPAIKKVLTAFGNGFKKAREIISTVWNKISNAIGTAWDWIKKNVFSKISLGLKILRAAFVFYRTKVQQIWNKFKEILKAGWDWVRKNVFDRLKGGLNAVRDRFASIRDRIKGIWTNLRDRLRDGWNWVRDNVFAKFKSGLGNLKDAFVNVKDGIRTAWNKLKEIAAKPVNFILGTVYNDGIRKWWNKISDAVGLSGLNLPRASTVKFASGGVLPGYTPGRDVHEFYSPTGGRLSLSGGEAIMRPEFTRAVGGPAGVAALNARARRGEAFADGGVWNWLGGVASGIGRGIKGFGNTLWNAGKMALEVIKDPIGAIKRAVSQIIGGAGTGGNRGDFFKIVGALPSKFAVGLADKVKSLFDSGKGKGASGIFGAGGGGVGGGGLRGNLSAMAAAARALDPSVRVTSGLRPGARTVTGYVSYHSRGRAIDMVSNNMGALWDKLYAAYGKSAPELFYSGRAFSRFGQKGAPRSDHWDHVHWAMANGGVLPKLFDQGGWLPTGTTLVQNNTGKPEPVFTSDQFERLASRGGDTYHIHGVDEASVISGIERVHRRAAVRNNMYGR